MACCGLSRGVALVAGKRVGTAQASSWPQARVRLPAHLTARSLTTVTRCARGRVDIFIHPGAGRGMNTGGGVEIFIHPRTEHGNQRADDGVKRPAAGRRHEDAAASAALAGAVADAFRPLLDNLKHLRSLKTVLDIEDYHIGMPFGALVACVGLYQVWKVAPWACLDVALAYAYKLSVIAADLRKRGYSNQLIARIQLAIAITMALNDAHKKFVPLANIRLPVFILYAISVLYDLTGLKKYVKSVLDDAF